MIEQFLNYLEHDRNRSPHTVRRYRATLEAIPGGLHATRTQIDQWWNTRLDLSPATRAGDLAAARSFYRWATRNDHRPDDPTRHLDAPAVENTLPRLIGAASVAVLLGEATHDRPDLRRALALGLHAGLRIHEAAKADWADTDHDQRILYVRGKGGLERAVPLSVTLLDHLLPDTGGNIITGGGEPISADTLGRACNRLIQKHLPGFTYHDARKRAASIALAKGASMPGVMRFFGWRSLATVEHYAAVTDDELTRIADLIG